MDRHSQARLRKELVIWLVTAGKSGRPQAVPVWFLWDGSSFLIYAQDGAKVSHIRVNPNVELHLNSDEVGDGVVRAAGKASISQKPAHRDAAYMRKYRRSIKDLGMTPEQFSATYHNAVRIRSVRFR